MSASHPMVKFFEIQAIYAEAQTASAHLRVQPESEGRTRIAKGLPWIDAKGLAPDPEEVRTTLDRILGDLQASTASTQSFHDLIASALRAGTLSPLGYLRAVLDQDGEAIDTLAEGLRVPTQLLHFIGVLLARPFLIAARRGFDPSLIDPETARAACPACGQEPALAFLLPDDGQRRLWCRYCRTEWAVRRLRCMSCGNEDGTTLGYLTFENETRRRIDYCELCRRYIKTIDLRATGQKRIEIQEDVEDLLSAELDAAAVRDGYLPLTAADAPAEWRRTGMGTDRKRGGSQ